MDVVDELQSHPSLIIILVGFMATLASAIYVCINKNDMGKDKRHGYHEFDGEGQRWSIMSDYSTHEEYTFYRGSPTSSHTNVISTQINSDEMWELVITTFFVSFCFVFFIVLMLYKICFKNRLKRKQFHDIGAIVFQEKVRGLIIPNDESEEEE